MAGFYYVVFTKKDEGGRTIRTIGYTIMGSYCMGTTRVSTPGGAVIPPEEN